MTGYLADLLLELGPRHAADKVVVNSVAHRIGREDYQALKELNHVLGESEAKEFSEAVKDHLGISLGLKPAPRRKFGDRRKEQLDLLRQLNL